MEQRRDGNRWCEERERSQLTFVDGFNMLSEIMFDAELFTAVLTTVRLLTYDWKKSSAPTQDRSAIIYSDGDRDGYAGTEEVMRHTGMDQIVIG